MPIINLTMDECNQLLMALSLANGRFTMEGQKELPPEWLKELTDKIVLQLSSKEGIWKKTIGNL